MCRGHISTLLDLGVYTMKKCPVCGVMMGDNVARCSMCKYDFQKASGGDTDAALAEAQQVLTQKEEKGLHGKPIVREQKKKSIWRRSERR